MKIKTISEIRKIVKDSNIEDCVREGLINQVEADRYTEYTNDVKHIEDIAEPQSTEIVRNEDDKIIGYKFNIKRRSGGPLIGTFSRDEMDRLCSLYSRYGADLTLAQTAQDFEGYSLDELNRIRNAFSIFKYTGPFALHMIEETPMDELHNIAIQRKANNITRTLEKDQLKDARKVNLILAKENKQLKDVQEYISNLKIDLNGLDTIQSPHKAAGFQDETWSLMLNLADLHVGAKVESHSLYDNSWTEEDINSRLYNILNQIKKYGLFKNIYLNLLGDMLDGMDGQTARRDHIMPQGMDNYQQIDVFVRQILWFINGLSHLAANVTVYSVPNGNHCGATEYAVIKLVEATINSNKFPTVQMKVFDKFIGNYEVGDHCFLILHGKDQSFMKKPLPLHLDSNTITWLNNYMDRSGITSKYVPGNIHIIKGDLHTAGYDSTYKFDYRNCLSLFGDSDYSQMNYNSNPRGCSYSILTDDHIINGEFIVE